MHSHYFSESLILKNKILKHKKNLVNLLIQKGHLKTFFWGTKKSERTVKLIRTEEASKQKCHLVALGCGKSKRDHAFTSVLLSQDKAFPPFFLLHGPGWRHQKNLALFPILFIV